jgi:hypothetical protein
VAVVNAVAAHSGCPKTHPSEAAAAAFSGSAKAAVPSSTTTSVIRITLNGVCSCNKRDYSMGKEKRMGNNGLYRFVFNVDVQRHGVEGDARDADDRKRCARRVEDPLWWTVVSAVDASGAGA